jgi:hypothetical protein
VAATVGQTQQTQTTVLAGSAVHQDLDLAAEPHKFVVLLSDMGGHYMAVAVAVLLVQTVVQLPVWVATAQTALFGLLNITLHKENEHV